jgi:hypothetical protein
VAVRGPLANAVQLLRGGDGGRRNFWSASGGFWNQFTPAREARPPLQEYTLVAPSVEEAKQFAEDFLHAYDEGFVPWLQKSVEEGKAALEKSRDEARPKLIDLDKRIAAASREVEGVEYLDPQAMSDLKVKRTLLKVELAGVKARVSSIEEKLKEGLQARRPVEFVDKLTDLKVSADIEQASLAAQQKVLDELLDGQRRLAEIARLRNERNPYAEQIKTADEGLPRCDEILADLKPFQLVDETVVIRPLRFRAE